VPRQDHGPALFRCRRVLNPRLQRRESHHIEHERPQLLGVIDPVPRAIAADDDAMRRADAQLLLDVHEVHAEFSEKSPTFAAIDGWMVVSRWTTPKRASVLSGCYVSTT